jgi:hypothetical protein
MRAYRTRFGTPQNSGVSLAFIERTAPKNRIQASDFAFQRRTGLAFHWRTATAEVKKINEHAPARPCCRRPKLVRSMIMNESAKLARVRS